MLNKLIALALRNRIVVLAVAALMLAAGAWTAWRMPVDVFPDLTAPTGDRVGQARRAALAETSFTPNVPMTLDAILAEDHAINVHLSADPHDFEVMNVRDRARRPGEHGADRIFDRPTCFAGQPDRLRDR